MSNISDFIHATGEELLPYARRRPEWRGLLASKGLRGQAVKGVYFFAGERGTNAWTYTAHPLDVRDEHWNSDPTTHSWVMDRLVRAHVNTVVMSFWSNMRQWSPMQLDDNSLVSVLHAVQNRPLVIMPAIESGYDPEHPTIPHWEFSNDFPHVPNGVDVAPGLIERIGELVTLFKDHMHLWARMYDRDGHPRYAVNIIHVGSDVIDQNAPDADAIFAAAFDKVAKAILMRHQLSIGFTLDVIGDKRYSAYPKTAGKALEETASVLAIQGFASEVFSGRIKNGSACPDPTDWRQCQARDNNIDNLENLADWKREAVHDWVQTGVPVILDVSNGFDGRIVWKKNGAAFWGDNLDYTDDRWRNWLSQLKGPGIRGITFNTWNGYTEGYAATPTREHGWTVYNWLTDLFEPPPWDYSHMHYVNGARTHRVYGAICEKWIHLGGDRGFGAPVSEELPSTLGRMQYFADGKAIYWSKSTGAHALYGLIAKTYREEGGDASKLGLPTSDELPNGTGRMVVFQRGRIEWVPGEARGRVIYL